MRINSINSAQYYMQPKKNKDNDRIKIPASTTSYKSNAVAFSGNPFENFIRIFDVINPKVTPLERLQHLAEEAQTYSEPLSDAMYRKDFKGIISKEKIVEILKSAQAKADRVTGAYEDFQELIDHVKKTH